MSKRSKKKKSSLWKIIASVVAVALVAVGGYFIINSLSTPKEPTNEPKVTQETKKPVYTASAEEKEYLSNKFKGLTSTNSEAIAYVYAPGTQ